MRPSLKRLPAVHSTWCSNRKVSYCAKHTRTNNYIFICHTCEISLYFFFSVWLCREIGKKFEERGEIEGYCKYSLLVFCDCLDWYRRTHQCTVSNQRPIK